MWTLLSHHRFRIGLFLCFFCFFVLHPLLLDGGMCGLGRLLSELLLLPLQRLVFQDQLLENLERREGCQAKPSVRPPEQQLAVGFLLEPDSALLCELQSLSQRFDPLFGKHSKTGYSKFIFLTPLLLFVCAFQVRQLRLGLQGQNRPELSVRLLQLRVELFLVGLSYADPGSEHFEFRNVDFEGFVVLEEAGDCGEVGFFCSDRWEAVGVGLGGFFFEAEWALEFGFCFLQIFHHGGGDVDAEAMVPRLAEVAADHAGVVADAPTDAVKLFALLIFGVVPILLDDVTMHPLVDVQPQQALVNRILDTQQPRSWMQLFIQPLFQPNPTLD
mmetsp:Transcript_5724/g.10536  ORF Transcript_5724/g.10536 Transcript_5724/m.10536 type:complete len:329 (+) Transcript_5724:125-1111(+)